MKSDQEGIGIRPRALESDQGALESDQGAFKSDQGALESYQGRWRHWNTISRALESDQGHWNPIMEHWNPIMRALESDQGHWNPIRGIGIRSGSSDLLDDVLSAGRRQSECERVDGATPARDTTASGDAACRKEENRYSLTAAPSV